MKAYGVRKKDSGCCGGHDKHPPTNLRYNYQKGNVFKRKDRPRKKRQRQLNKLITTQI